MILYPAIDLKGGDCVRLVRGEMASATVFNTDPAAQARHFAEAGFSWLHVVDLDGAFAGKSVNGDAVRAIHQAVDLKIQLGGGIRDRAAIDNWLALGIERVVLGSAALRDPALVREAARAFPGRIAVGIDARDGHVAVEGWAETSDIGAITLARRFVDAGVASIIYTDIGRDTGRIRGGNLFRLPRSLNADRIHCRRDLLRSFDRLRAGVDAGGSMTALDSYQRGDLTLFASVTNFRRGHSKN